MRVLALIGLSPALKRAQGTQPLALVPIVGLEGDALFARRIPFSAPDVPSSHSKRGFTQRLHMDNGESTENRALKGSLESFQAEVFCCSFWRWTERRWSSAPGRTYGINLGATCRDCIGARHSESAISSFDQVQRTVHARAHRHAEPGRPTWRSARRSKGGRSR